MWPFILSLGIWNWFIAGVLLLILEIVVPGTFMLWLGLAAFLVGAISFAVDWSWQYQFVAFAIFSILMIPLWRRIAARTGGPTDTPFLNRRAEAFVGRVFTLEKPIVGGNGTIGIDDSVWRIAGADCPAGSRVRIVAADGALLRVERAE